MTPHVPPRSLKGLPIVTDPPSNLRLGRNRIGAVWRTGASGEFLAIRSPCTGEPLGHVTLSTTADVDAAVVAARAAQPAFGRLSVFDRAKLCGRIADVIETRADDLARLLCLEQGKPFHAEAKGEVAGAVLGFRNAAEQIKWLETASFPVMDGNKRAFSFLQPKGTFAVVTPWNFPLAMPSIYYLGPGLATGNAMVWVPAPTTSLIAAALMDCMIEAGVPDGVVNLVLGDGAVVGDAAVAHAGTDAVAFTGSSATGFHIARRAAGKPLMLELGGNGPTIVMEDADVEMAAARIATGCFANAGQICTASERVLVHEAVHDRLVDGLVKAAGTVRLGDPFDPATTMGPLNNVSGVEKVEEHLADARARDARVLCGGGVAPGLATTLHYQPTVVTGLTAECLLNVDESFGPVAPVLTFRDTEDALRLAATSRFGLSAAVFTRTIRNAFAVAEALKVGIVNVNEMSCYWEPHIPAGGAAGTQSGIGRTGGRHTLMDMSDLKTITMDVTQ